MQGPARIDLPGLAVHALCDGAYTFGPEVFPGIGDQTRAARLAEAGLDSIDTEFGAYLLRYDTGPTVLIDSGCGTLYGDAAGRLLSDLDALGVAPADIDTLVFTHLHGDHCGGAIEDGRAVFARAEVVLHEAELDHWKGQTGPASQALELYAGRLRTVTDGADLAPGVTAWHLPGHTPGHMGLRLGDSHVLVADILHSFALQLADPDLCAIYDADPDTARASRRAALSEIAERGLVWSGSHGLSPDRFLRLSRKGDGFVAHTA